MTLLNHWVIAILFETLRNCLPLCSASSTSQSQGSQHMASIASIAHKEKAGGGNSRHLRHASGPGSCYMVAQSRWEYVSILFLIHLGFCTYSICQHNELQAFHGCLRDCACVTLFHHLSPWVVIYALLLQSWCMEGMSSERNSVMQRCLPHLSTSWQLSWAYQQNNSTHWQLSWVAVPLIKRRPTHSLRAKCLRAEKWWKMVERISKYSNIPEHRHEKWWLILGSFILKL